MEKLNLQPDKTRQKENALKSKPKSILESFEYIVELAENSNLDDEFFQKAGAHIKYASRKLKLTPMQTVLLVEKARAFDPFGHAGFDPSGKIRMTP